MNYGKSRPKLRLTFLPALLLALSFTNSQAQDNDPLCSAEFARMIVEQQASELNLNTEKPKKVRILIAVADFLWDLDQPAARKYFAEARRTAIEFREELKSKPKSNDSGFNPEPDYEMTVISAIAKRDPKWAEAIFREILNKAVDDKGTNSDDDLTFQRLNALLSIASANAGTNPDLSLKLFRLAIANFRLDNPWVYALFDAAKQNRAVANLAAIELLQKNSDADLSQLLYVSHFALGLPNGLGYSRPQIGITIDENFTIDPQVRDTFLNIFLSRAENYLSNPANITRQPGTISFEIIAIYSALEALQPMLPSLPAEIQRRVSIAKMRASSFMAKSDYDFLKNQQSRSFGRTIDQRIAALEAAEKENRLTDDEIVKAVFTASGSVSELQGFQPWLEKIESEETRTATYAYYWMLLTEAAVKEDSLNEAERFAEKISRPVLRAAMMFKVAKARLKDLNNLVDAYEILSRVSAATRKAPDSADKASVLIGLANVYVDFNPSFAFSEFSDAVKALNSSGPHRQIPGMTLLTIKTSKNSTYSISPGSPEFSLIATVRKLSKTDLGLTLSNAKALDDPYLRAVAVMAAMGSCAEKQKSSK